MRYTKEYLNLTEQTETKQTESDTQDPIWKDLLKRMGLGGLFGVAAATGQLGQVLKIALSPIGAQMPRMSPASHAGGKSSFHTAIKDISGTVTGGTIAKTGETWRGIKRQKGPFSEYPTDPRADPKTRK